MIVPFGQGEGEVTQKREKEGGLFNIAQKGSAVLLADLNLFFYGTRVGIFTSGEAYKSMSLCHLAPADVLKPADVTFG